MKVSTQAALRQYKKHSIQDRVSFWAFHNILNAIKTHTHTGLDAAHRAAMHNIRAELDEIKNALELY